MRSARSAEPSWGLPVFVPAACADAGASQFGVNWTEPGRRPKNRAMRSQRITTSDVAQTVNVASIKKIIVSPRRQTLTLLPEGVIIIKVGGSPQMALLHDGCGQYVLLVEDGMALFSVTTQREMMHGVFVSFVLF